MKIIEITPYMIEGEWDWRDVSAGMPQGWIPRMEMGKGTHNWGFRAGGVMTGLLYTTDAAGGEGG